MRELRAKPVTDKIKEACLDYAAERNGELISLAILRVGSKEEDIAYEKSVKKSFINYGLEVKDYELPENVSFDEFRQTFDFLNNDSEIQGILVMRPLPDRLQDEYVIKNLRPEKDLDGITDVNAAGVMRGDADAFAPCTAEAVIKLIKGYNIPLEGKHVVVLGRSMVVGKPLSMMLLKENASVTVCHSRSERLKEITSQADILVSAIGRAKEIGSSYIKEDAVVIDVGINIDKNGKLCGDCDYDTMATKASALSPVPGGLGPVTTAVLAEHLIRAAKLQRGE